MNDAFTQGRAPRKPDHLLSTTTLILQIAQFISLIRSILSILILIVPITYYGIPTSTSKSALLLVMTGIVGLGASAIFVYFLLGNLIKIVNSVGYGEAFTMINAKRIRKISYLYVGISIAEFVHASYKYYTHEPARDGRHIFEWESSSLIVMLILFVLARVFEEGVRLNDESRLTV